MLKKKIMKTEQKKKNQNGKKYKPKHKRLNFYLKPKKFGDKFYRYNLPFLTPHIEAFVSNILALIATTFPLNIFDILS